MKFGLVPAAWIVAILYIWMPSPGHSLKCHVCNSLYNDSCVMVENNKYLTDCMKINQDPNKNYTLCRKEVFSVSSQAPVQMQSSRTIRSCGYEKHPKFNCFFNSNHDLKETICECTEDGCNASNNLHFSIQYLVTGVLSVYLMSSIIR